MEGRNQKLFSCNRRNREEANTEGTGGRKMVGTEPVAGGEASRSLEWAFSLPPI